MHGTRIRCASSAGSLSCRTNRSCATPHRSFFPCSLHTWESCWQCQISSASKISSRCCCVSLWNQKSTQEDCDPSSDDLALLPAHPPSFVFYLVDCVVQRGEAQQALLFSQQFALLHRVFVVLFRFSLLLPEGMTSRDQGCCSRVAHLASTRSRRKTAEVHL